MTEKMLKDKIQENLPSGAILISVRSLYSGRWVVIAKWDRVYGTEYVTWLVGPDYSPYSGNYFPEEAFLEAAVNFGVR